MARRGPTSVRFDPEVAERLSAHAARRPGASVSSTANRLVDEGLRRADHPQITFRDGPMGRRAGLVTGPDVWEVVRAVRSARTSDPSRSEADVLGLISETTGLAVPVIRDALRYWSEFTAEIDAEIDAADAAERAAVSAWERERHLLAPAQRPATA